MNQKITRKKLLDTGIKQLASCESFAEVMPELRSRSQIMILDFQQIKTSLPKYKNIALFFAHCLAENKNPRLPENRQKFNNNFLQQSGARYLIGRYGEDRIEMLKNRSNDKVKRVFHLGIDIFARNLELVFCPYDGSVIRVGRESGKYGYGYFVVIKHKTKGFVWYSFYGHLGFKRCRLGLIKKGDLIGHLGDYKHNINGGWSRHLHFQLMLSLPNDGMPYAYATKEMLNKYKAKYPNPNLVLRIKNLK